MKAKILSSLLLMLLISFSSFAWKKILIQGGGKNQRFNKVKVTEKEIECTGVGHLVCPVTWEAIGSPSAKTIFPLGEVVAYVQAMVEKGEMKGEAVYEGELPIEWYVSKEDLNITVYDDDSISFKPYEEIE